MNDYIGRVNRVLDYIENNLDRRFTLDELAGVAHFSKYHFHRLFQSLMGETLFRFIQRVRLERAANRLVFEPDSTITAIAIDCGFSSSAAFSKSFRENFRISPTEWKKKSLFGNPINTNSNLGQTDSNRLEACSDGLTYLGIQNGAQKWQFTAEGRTETITVSERPETTVIYVRHVGPYQQDFKLFERLNNRLFKWAAPRGLVDYQKTQYFVIAHDDPDITEEGKLRVSVCLSAPEDVSVAGDIGKMVVPGGSYAHIRFRINPVDIGTAWQWVFGCWLPVSGFVPDERPCLERYPLEADCNGDSEWTDLEICVPVRPL